MMAQPMKTLELHYPMIQFLILLKTPHTYYINRTLMHIAKKNRTCECYGMQ